MTRTGETIPETYALDNARDEAQARMAALSAVYDNTTQRHLQRVGITHGWRCLEVGAGSPSIPAWMAEQVDPGGSVLVTDINTRFLNTPRIRTAGPPVLRVDVVRTGRPQAGVAGCAPRGCRR
jgi:hypothetical protein